MNDPQTIALQSFADHSLYVYGIKTAWALCQNDRVDLVETVGPALASEFAVQQPRNTAAFALAERRGVFFFAEKNQQHRRKQNKRRANDIAG